MLRARNLILSASFVLATALTPVAAQAASKGIAGAANPQMQAKRAPTVAACGAMRANLSASTLDFSSTTSTSFVNIPEGTVPFGQANFRGCVIVNFSAMTFAPSGALLYVRAVLDGVTVSLPAETQLSGDDDEDANGRWARSNDYNFIFPDVATGPHTVQMQFRSFDGQSVTMHRHATVVYHR